MKGYVARKGERWYAVIYEGLDPVTGKERRTWHAAGSDRVSAEQLARRLAAAENGRNDDNRSLSLGAYLTTRWLPGKRLSLRVSTYDGYRRKIERHVLPTLGKISVRRLRPAQLEALYEHLLRPTDGTAPLAPKTVVEVHLILRAALSEAVRSGIVARNVALDAHTPSLRRVPVERQAWTAEQLQAFLRAAAAHRLFPAFWLAAATGMRRSELLGLRWGDVDFEHHTVSVNRGLVSVAYELHESPGKTPAARRSINLDPATIGVLQAWKAWQHTAQAAVGAEGVGWVFADADGQPVHPHAISQAFERVVAHAGVPAIPFHEVRHTHATLLIKAGVPAKVVSERLGHANPAFTILTYQHIIPGMQADAARTYQHLIGAADVGLLPAAAQTGRTRLNTRKKTA